MTNLKDNAWADEPPAVVIGSNSHGFEETDRLVKNAAATNKLHQAGRTVAVTPDTKGDALAQAYDGRWDEFVARVVALDMGFIVQHEPGETINQIGWFGQTDTYQRSKIGKVHVFQSFEMQDYNGMTRLMEHSNLGMAFMWLENEEADKRDRETKDKSIGKSIAEVNEELERGPKRAEAAKNIDKLLDRVEEQDARIAELEKKLTTNSDDA